MLTSVDLVIWDSHPLALGASPVQVLIDGIPQLASSHVVPKPASQQRAPHTPDFDKEADDAVQYEGLPPLEPVRSRSGVVVLTNVSAVFTESADGQTIVETFVAAADSEERQTVVVHEGKIVCRSAEGLSTCSSFLPYEDYTVVDVLSGALQPGLVTAGSTLGLQEIAFETSTSDGSVLDPLSGNPPFLVGGEGYMPLAVDGLQFGTRDALCALLHRQSFLCYSDYSWVFDRLAYRAGVTAAISAPPHGSFLGGLSVAFSTAPANKLEQGAVIQGVTALHVSVGHGSLPSLSTTVGALRRMLLDPLGGDAGYWIHALTQVRRCCYISCRP